MKIVKGYPPNYDRIAEQFTLDSSVIFTYGDTIYVPGGGDLNKPLIIHESIHSKQQADMGIEKWWKNYFEDEKFRLSQEVEAYRNQFVAYKGSVHSQVKIAVFLNGIAKDLSSDIYGNIITLEEAIKLIV